MTRFGYWGWLSVIILVLVLGVVLLYLLRYLFRA